VDYFRQKPGFTLVTFWILSFLTEERIKSPSQHGEDSNPTAMRVQKFEVNSLNHLATDGSKILQIFNLKQQQ
jgi:hypothetical protein